MTLAAVYLTYLVTAMKAWVPISEHAFYEPSFMTEQRYQAIAEDVLASAEAQPLFAGEYGVLKTALFSLSFASWESHYAKRIDECKPLPNEADRDKDGNATAFSLWQMHEERGRPRKEYLCASRKNAAAAFLTWAKEALTVCRHLDQLDRMSHYTDGGCRKNWRRSRERTSRAFDWFDAHPVAVERVKSDT